MHLGRAAAAGVVVPRDHHGAANVQAGRILSQRCRLELDLPG